MARRRNRERVALPWERRAGSWRGVVSQTRWQALLGIILGGLLLIGFARYTRHRVRLRNTEVAIEQVEQAIDQFRADVGRCPSSQAELLHPPLPQKHYLDTMPRDGWGRPFSIRCPGFFSEAADVISAGPSGSLLEDDNIQ
ncbi:MAG: type II secretion system protein GspG [Myxococcales bacterium]